MRPFIHSLTITAALSNLLGAYGGQVQKQGLRLPASAAGHRQDVIQAFTDAYSTYRKFAFGHDDLMPVSLSFNDGRNGWGATIVDAMDTAFVMGLNDFFNEAVNFSSRIDFSKSQVPSESVSVFETTIRYLGGLLSAFELSGQQHPVLLQKAKEVGDKLVFAWLGNNSVPFNDMNFTINTPIPGTSNIAQAGTLTLEFGTLSRLTGNDTYRQLAEKSVRHIAALPDPLPGLAAQGIDPASGQFTDASVSWGGGSDSYFEYLIKYARLTNTDDPLFADTWKLAVDTSIRVLAKTSTVGNHLYLADFNDQRMISHVSSHLACFHGGNFILGGQLLNNQTIVNFGLGLVEACWNTYASTATGIGPEVFAFVSKDGNFTGGPPMTPADIAFNKQHGFYIFDGDSDYILRPEVLESNFYAWRVTGNTKYLDRAASALSSFNRFLKINNAFSGINDVNSRNSSRIDDTESFFFAEVLKYLFLTFDDPNHISLDNFVFNTESHPLSAPPAKATYGSDGLKQPNAGPFTTVPGPRPAVSTNPFVPPLQTPSSKN